MAHRSSLRRTLASLPCFLHRSPSSSFTTSLPRFASRPNARFASGLPNERPSSSIRTPYRLNTLGSASEPLNSALNDRDEEVVIDGCDFEHWLVIMGFPEKPRLSEEEMVNAYVSTLAKVVGSEEEAKKKIYSVSTVTYTGFGALLSREVSKGLKGLPGVLWVLPDSYLDVPTKDYGGDLFVNGKVIHRPEYRFSNGLEQPMDSEFDDFYYNEHGVDDFDREKYQETDPHLFQRLRKTLRTGERELKLRSRKSEVTNEEAGQIKTEEPEESQASKGLQEVFSALKEKLNTVKIEAGSLRNESSDLPYRDNCIEQIQDQPDLNKLKEALKTFRLGSNLDNGDGVDTAKEETDRVQEKSTNQGEI